MVQWKKTTRNVVIPLPKRNLLVSLCSNIGTTRKINQDNYYINGEILRDPHRRQVAAKGEFEQGIFAIADGMGGESDGEFASLCAVQSLQKLQDRADASFEEIRDCVNKANEEICRKMARTGKQSGTTIVLAAVTDREVSIYNIGDSKCILIHEGKLMQLSRDHTVTAQMIDAGLMTPAQAKNDRRSHQLFQHLGIDPEEMTLSVYAQEKIPFEPRDLLLLCSDGLTDGLSEEQILEMVRQNHSHDTLAKELVAAAMENGSKDNVSVLAIRNGRKSGAVLRNTAFGVLCGAAAAMGIVTGLLAARFWG